MVNILFVAEIAQKTPENPYYDWVFNRIEKDTKKQKKIPFGIFSDGNTIEPYIETALRRVNRQLNRTYAILTLACYVK